MLALTRVRRRAVWHLIHPSIFPQPSHWEPLIIVLYISNISTPCSVPSYWFQAILSTYQDIFNYWIIMQCVRYHFQVCTSCKDGKAFALGNAPQPPHPYPHLHQTIPSLNNPKLWPCAWHWSMTRYADVTNSALEVLGILPDRQRRQLLTLTGEDRNILKERDNWASSEQTRGDLQCIKGKGHLRGENRMCEVWGICESVRMWLWLQLGARGVGKKGRNQLGRGPMCCSLIHVIIPQKSAQFCCGAECA